MGWLFSYTGGKAELLSKLRSPEHCAPHKMIANRVVGNHFWSVVELESGQRFVCLDLMASGGRQGLGWGHKDMDESMHPYYFDCPLSLLDIAGPTNNPASQAWREQVLKHHANRVKPASGLYISYGQHVYRLDKPFAPRRGWWAYRIDDGSLWRLKANQIANARVV